MKFIYGERELTLEFRENEVQVITIENREYFSAFLQNLYNQSQGSEGDSFCQMMGTVQQIEDELMNYMED